jgi:hypothetical protein
MEWLLSAVFSVCNFFSWMEPRRGDGAYHAECRRATRQAFWSTAGLLALVAASSIVSSLLDNASRAGALSLVVPAIRDYFAWGFLGLCALLTLNVCASGWTLYRLHKA